MTLTDYVKNPRQFSISYSIDSVLSSYSRNRLKKQKGTPVDCAGYAVLVSNVVLMAKVPSKRYTLIIKNKKIVLLIFSSQHNILLIRMKLSGLFQSVVSISTSRPRMLLSSTKR